MILQREPPEAFVSYVCDRLLGRRSGGCWTCPICHHRNASVTVKRSVSKPRKARWRCHRCGNWGDEKDLLAWFGFEGRKLYDRLGIMRLEFEAGVKADPTLFPSPMVRKEQDDQEWVMTRWGHVMSHLEKLGIDEDRAFAAVEAHAKANGWEDWPEDLMTRLYLYWRDFREWVASVRSLP